MISWCEIDRSAIRSNLQEFQRLTGERVELAPVVKANAYGHGLVDVAHTLVDSGAGWLCVNEVDEAVALRQAGIACRIYVVGYVPRADLSLVVDADADIVVYNSETVSWLAELKPKRAVRLHIKVETGNNRQGVAPEEVLGLATQIQQTDGVALEGLTTHFADIEDTTDHAFAMGQLRRFKETLEGLEGQGFDVPYRHCTNTAAVILYPATYFNLVRVGIGIYGMWPSRETLVTAIQARRDEVQLQPAMTWKSRVAQIKPVDRGQFVGYGRTYQTTHDTRIAVVPVGYYDGYDRRLSNLAHVLIRGHRARLLGRVCMNMIMVDVTHVPGIQLEDEVVLLGCQGEQQLAAEQLADWIGTINYEVTTRIHERLPRIPVN